MPGSGRVFLGLLETNPTRPVLGRVSSVPSVCYMLQDECMFSYDHFTDEESEVRNKQVPRPKSPGQHVPELRCAHRPC